MVTYASETLVLKETIIQKLLVFGTKILRRIFGPTRENQIWRIKTSEELDKLIKHKNIVNYTVCPTCYRTLHFFNNSNTNEDIEQEYIHCVRNEEECVCSVCL